MAKWYLREMFPRLNETKVKEGKMTIKWDKNDHGFKNLRKMFPKLNKAKLKKHMFIGPQIRKLLKEPMFDSKLTNVQLAAWTSFRYTAHGFLGNKKDDGYAFIAVY